MIRPSINPKSGGITPLRDEMISFSSRKTAPLLRWKKDRAATTFIAQPFPGRHRRRCRRKLVRLTDSSPALFSLLRPPISTPEDRVGFDGSWIKVSDTPKLQTLDLIRRRRSVTTTPSSEPPAQPASTATAPALMYELPDGPGVSQAPASSTSSVGQPVSARRWHRLANTTDTTSTDSTVASGQEEHLRAVSATEDDEGHPGDHISIEYDERHRAAPTAELRSSLAHDIRHVVRTHCLMQWKSWKVMPDEIKMEVRGQLSTSYNLVDLDEESLAYVNKLFGERYKQWKSDLHRHF
ncbi:unnamed protein product [Prunus armeniaca]